MPELSHEPRLIDSSVWIRADRKGHEALKQRLRTLIIAGSAWICWPIRAELLMGVKSRREWTALEERLAALEHAPLNEETWRRAARLGHSLARGGQSVPLSDLLLAAAAIERDLVLWTVDADFKRIASVAPLRLDWSG